MALRYNISTFCCFVGIVMCLIDLSAQCERHNEIRSHRLANYVMEVSLDRNAKLITGHQQIEWINNSPDTVDHLMMYMYMNAFKNTESSYLRHSTRSMTGNSLIHKEENDWGYIELSEVVHEGRHLATKYIQNLDDNSNDQTALRVDLKQGVAPGDTLRLTTQFVTKLPRTIVRSGYSSHDFFHFVHWYPKLGVYEIDEQDQWGWNCHQFLPQMEFYGEFGTYEVTIHCDSDFKVGGSGCHTWTENGKGQTTHHFIAEDVIDFGWCAFPHFDVYEDNWKGIEIEVLSPPSHKSLVPRILGAVKNCLEFYDKHIGIYPYPKITIMDPPLLGLRSGFMEYPSYITGGSIYGFPKGIKSLESLIVHEFSHQYFMAILATNEKESPWLDEGFVTFFEDEIMEYYYGGSDLSLIDFFGYRVGNSALTRQEYTGIRNKGLNALSDYSWQIRGDYKGTVYAKTATVLRTLKNLIGKDNFYLAVNKYYQKHQFSHPRKSDFYQSIKDVIMTETSGNRWKSIKLFLDQAIDGREVCDFEVISATTDRILNGAGLFDDHENKKYREPDYHNDYISRVIVEQKGDFIAEVEVLLYFENGHKELVYWDGTDRRKEIVVRSDSPLRTAHVDPQRRYQLDIDFANNSYTLQPQRMGMAKQSFRVLYWVQQILQASSIFT